MVIENRGGETGVKESCGERDGEARREMERCTLVWVDLASERWREG
jgi:hypothetical protein